MASGVVSPLRRLLGKIVLCSSLPTPMMRQRSARRALEGGPLVGRPAATLACPPPLSPSPIAAFRVAASTRRGPHRRGVEAARPWPSWTGAPGQAAPMGGWGRPPGEVGRAERRPGRQPPAAVGSAGETSRRRAPPPCGAWPPRLPPTPRRGARPGPLRGCRPTRPRQPGTPQGIARPSGPRRPRGPPGAPGGVGGGGQWSKPHHTKRGRRPRPFGPTGHTRPRRPARGPRPTLASRVASPGGPGEVARGGLPRGAHHAWAHARGLPAPSLPCGRGQAARAPPPLTCGRAAPPRDGLGEARAAGGAAGEETAPGARPRRQRTLANAPERRGMRPQLLPRMGPCAAQRGPPLHRREAPPSPSHSHPLDRWEGRWERHGHGPK